jgi:glycosidase
MRCTALEKKRHGRLSLHLLARLALPLAIGAGCGEAMMAESPPADLPPDPPVCAAPPAALTAATSCPSPPVDPLACEESRRSCKEKYSFPHQAGITSVELRGSYRPLGWDLGYPLKLSADGKSWEGELYLPNGREVEVKFVLNGSDWRDDPSPLHPGSKFTARCSTAPIATCDRQPLGEAVACLETAPPDADFDWRDAVMYFTFVDRFFNGAPGNDKPLVSDKSEKPGDYLGGDYAGITKKITEGYFTSLGVNVLWVTVPFDNPDFLSPIDPKADKRQVGGHAYSGYHGYWPMDQWPMPGPMQGPRVEEHFGTEAELKELVARAHEKGIKVLFDYAMVHVHESSALYKQHAPALDPSGLPVRGADGKSVLDAAGQPAWFWPNVALKDDLLPILKNGAPQECICSSDAENPCQWDGTKDNPLIGTRCAFQGYLPHFNYDVPAALEYSLDAAVRLLRDTGADGYRADAVKHISERWYKGLRARLLREFPNKRVFVTGETYDFGSRPNLKRFVDPSTMLDGHFDFPLRANLASAVLARGQTGKHLPMWELAEFVRTNDTFYGCASTSAPPPVMSPWIGNHDVVRPIHVAENDPLFDEWANGKDSDPAKERTWASLPRQPEGPEPYERLANAFAVLFTSPGAPLIYYGDEYGLAGGGDPDNRRLLFWPDGTLRGAVRSCHQLALFERVKKLAAIRRAHPALRRGTRQTIEATDDLWVYSMATTLAWRGEPAEKIYVAINRSDQPQTACSLPTSGLRELVGDQRVMGPAVIIPPRQARIFITE